MAKCPKCNRKLHIWNIKAECPDCGVNIANYDWENRLEQDSIEAEAAFAKLHETMNKFKYSFVGTKLRIARIPVSVLPLFSLLLPFGTMAVSIPFCDEKITINAVTMVLNLLNFDILGIFKAAGSEVIGEASLRFMLSIVFVVLAALSLLVSLGFLMLNFKKFNSKGLFMTNLFASLCMLASAFCFHDFSGMIQASTLADAIQCGPSWGIFVSAAIYLASSITNLIVSLQPVNLPVEEEKKEEKETVNA
ncbi:MAG: hypothetical protein IKW12_00720 [Clostridia bacterium]|nr:hypothetical protein [Clostridia bacterium]